MSQSDTATGAVSSCISLADGLAAKWQDSCLLAARVLLGAIFVQGGWTKLMDITAFVNTMPRRGLPDFLGYIAPPVELLGGLCMVFGIATRYTSLVMILFIVIASFSSHRFWAVDAAQYANQFTHFWKNMTMTGGTVLLFVTGAGRYAVDHVLMRK